MFDRSLVLTSFAALTALMAVTSVAVVSAEDPPKKPTSVLDFHMKDIDGKDVDLAKYHGKVLLIVNTASQCGNTPQYKDLEAIYEKYKGQGFEVLAFPANEFGSQEPGDNSQIKQFCSKEYKVTFPLFSKIVVRRRAQASALPVPDERVDQSEVRRQDRLEFRQVPGQPQGRGDPTLRAWGKPLVRRRSPAPSRRHCREVIATAIPEIPHTGRDPNRGPGHDAGPAAKGSWPRRRWGESRTRPSQGRSALSASTCQALSESRIIVAGHHCSGLQLSAGTAPMSPPLPLDAGQSIEQENHTEPDQEVHWADRPVPPMIQLAQAAFRRDRPELLKTYKDRWVAYNGDLAARHRAIEIRPHPNYAFAGALAATNSSFDTSNRNRRMIPTGTTRETFEVKPPGCLDAHHSSQPPFLC